MKTFYECQQISKLRLLPTILIVTGVIIICALDNFDAILIPLIVCVVVCCVLFFVIMETVIDEEGINVRYGLKYTSLYTEYDRFSWEDIAKVYISKYKIAQLQTLSLVGYKSDIYNMKSVMTKNIGLHIKLKNGRELFISTNEVDSLTDVLKKLGKLSEQI
jgi:hypothetical protein